MVVLVDGKADGKSEGKLIVDGRAFNSLVLDEDALGVLSADRLKILRQLGNEPKYPAQVARELKMQVQTVYYHVRILSQAGLIKFVSTEEKGGATAKKFSAASDSLAFVTNPAAAKPFALAKPTKPPEFLAPFFDDGYFDAKIVLGSPDPHGKYRARGSELCSTELAMYLGRFGAFDYPLYYLDTEFRDKPKRGNVVAVGGSKVNSYVAEINAHLPIQFTDNFTIHSTASGKTYEESVGVVEVIRNPLNQSKRILVVAGTNHLSTRLAVLALIKARRKLEEGNRFDATKQANVVEGYDEDGDGIVDAVEVLE